MTTQAAENPGAQPGTVDPAAAAAAAAAQANGGGVQKDNGTGGTILDGGAGADGQERTQNVPADWPADWRTKISGGDESVLKRLERFNSPADIMKSYRALEQRLSSGEYKRAAPPDNATDEQMSAWRKENGIPDKPDGYDLTLDDGLVIGDADKPIVNEFLTEMHGQNATQAQVKATLNAYYRIEERYKADQKERDDAVKMDTEDSLRAEWGPDFRRNQGQITAFVEGLPDDLRDNLIGARLADGTKLLGNLAAVKFFAGLAAEANPMPTHTPGASGAGGVSVDDQIAAYEKRMGTNEWYSDTKAQAHYMQLVEVRDKIKKRA